jgi:hypothetical protein
MSISSEHRLNTFDLVMLAATRGMLGAGIGLLAANKLGDEQRKAVGTTLLAIGALSSVPLALRIFSGTALQSSAPSEPPAHSS